MKKQTHIYIFSALLITITALLSSCENNVLPKPKAFLRLEYPDATYKIENIKKMPFTFNRNVLGENLKTKTLKGNTTSYGITIAYPKLKGTIYLTYKGIDGNSENLNTFLRNAQNMTQEHTQKADAIAEQPFEDNKRKVYGMLYEVGGNAASQSQFYITDSINHFITGSLYFYAKPNYDSILPAAHYLKKDIKQIMETLEWK